MGMPGSTVFTEEHKKFLSPNQLVTRDRETGLIVTFTLNEEEFELGLSREMADLMFQRLENFQRGHKHLVGNFDLLWFNGKPVAEGEL
tara:strand:- start:2399 stop:2662 length:264 start_codon:yes stop_codon:yes gene_type:complete